MFNNIKLYPFIVPPDPLHHMYIQIITNTTGTIITTTFNYIHLFKSYNNHKFTHIKGKY